MVLIPGNGRYLSIVQSYRTSVDRTGRNEERTNKQATKGHGTSRREFSWEEEERRQEGDREGEMGQRGREQAAKTFSDIFTGEHNEPAPKPISGYGLHLRWRVTFTEVWNAVPARRGVRMAETF